MENQPRFLRLKNGDDIISEYVELTQNNNISLHLINPLKVMYVPGNRPGIVHIGLSPWIASTITSKQEFIIKDDDVILNSDVNDSMVEHYWASLEAFANPEPEQESYPEEEEIEEDIDTKRTYH